jgi:signal peptidase II
VNKKTGFVWLWLSIIMVGVDQWTKIMAMRHVRFDQVVPIFSWLNIILRYNRGAAYGFLAGQSGWQLYVFALFSLLVSIMLLVWLVQTPRGYWARCLGLSLVIAGAIGNGIDRVIRGFVIDFVDFHLRTWHFATFNVADACVSVGAFFLVLSFLFERKA